MYNDTLPFGSKNIDVRTGDWADSTLHHMVNLKQNIHIFLAI